MTVPPPQSRLVGVALPPPRPQSRPGGVAQPLPGRQTRPVGPAGPPVAGRVEVSDEVVRKVASRAATEVPDVGSATTSALGRLGRRPSVLGAPPGTEARVRHDEVHLQLTISVRYPSPVRQVAARLRAHLTERVEALTGKSVVEVEVRVPVLVTS